MQKKLENDVFTHQLTRSDKKLYRICVENVDAIETNLMDLEGKNAVYFWDKIKNNGLCDAADSNGHIRTSCGAFLGLQDLK